MKNNFLKLAAILLIAVSSCSCRKWIDDHINSKKYSPNCKTGDCVELNSKVSLFVKPTGEALSNVSIEVLFVSNSSNWAVALFTTPYKVASGKTDKNGVFNFKAKIDMTDFKDYSLIVRIPEQKDYFFTDFVRGTINHDVRRKFNSYNEEALKSINFELYKKTKLKINLKKTQSDDFQKLNINPKFGNNLYDVYSFSMTELITTENIQYETAANIYTKIIWWKIYKGGEQEYYIDSMICKPNIINEFNIYY